MCCWRWAGAGRFGIGDAGAGLPLERLLNRRRLPGSGFRGAFTTGSLLSFLIFGPMVDIKSTIMYLGVFKPKTVAFLVGLPLVLTFLVGVGLNLLGG